jgi:hypothetical protein
MSEPVVLGPSVSAGRPKGLVFVVTAAVVAFVALGPWLLAALFAPALLGAPGPSPSPLVILSIAAILCYPAWLVYWGLRAMAARRQGGTGRTPAAVMAAPALMLLAMYSSFNFGP